MTEQRWSTERVLEIGRDFQNEDKWHGAHWDTVKLLCDKIEELRDELEKHNRNCERFFNKSGEVSALAKSFDAYNAEKQANVHEPCWGWAYWLFSETSMDSESNKPAEDKTSPEEFKKLNNFRKYQDFCCLNCIWFKHASKEDEDEERARRRDHEPPRPIDFCTKTNPEMPVFTYNVCNAHILRKRDYGED